MDLPNKRGHHSCDIFSNINLIQKLASITLVLVWSVVLSNSARAGIAPRLEAALYYNDNVTLATPGQEQEAYITELKPGILLERDGRRFNGRLDYTLQVLNFSGDIDRTDTYHQLLANSTTMLVSQLLFLDAGASYSQQFISPDDDIALDNLSVTENRTDVLTYSLSPYVRQQYGSTANAEYRIGSQRVEYKESATVDQIDSTNSSAFITVESGPRFNQLRWGVTYSYDQIDYDEEGVDTTLQNTLLGLRYQLSPKFGVLTNIGYEDNEYEQVAGEDPPSGTIWSAGFAWTPSRQTSLEITTGERFFGSTASFNFRHRARQTEWLLAYTEDITTTPQLLAEYETGGDLGSGVSANPILRQTTSVIFLKRILFSFSLETSKTIVNAELFKDQREYQDTNQQEDVLSADISWRWRFMPRTTAILSTTWYETNPSVTDRTDRLMSNSLSVERRIRRTVTGIISYGTLKRDSEVESAEYERNLVSMALRAEF